MRALKLASQQALQVPIVGGGEGSVASGGAEVLAYQTCYGAARFLLLVTPARFERATYGLGNRRSIHLSYGALLRMRNITPCGVMATGVRTASMGWGFEP